MPEVELKFALDAEGRRRLVSAGALAGVRSQRRRMESLYFDTPQCDLARHEMALRMRRSGRHWVQTLKSGASGTGGLHSREEWEFERPGPHLDLSLFAQTPLAGLDAPATLHERLVAAFQVDFTRTTWTFSPAPGSTLEVALDSGTVASGGRSEAISEVEIECVQGDAGAAFDLATRLLEDVPLRPSAVTKARRGYRLFNHAPLRPVKASEARLEEAMSPLAGARALVAAGLDQLQANEEGVLRGGAPEFVHQARVALRRMRSALRMFRGAIGEERAQAWRDELGEAAQALGVGRDWDVFAIETLPALGAAYGDATLARALARRASMHRRRGREGARAAIQSPRYARVILELSRWLARLEGDTAEAAAEPLADFASRLIRKRHKRLLAGIESLPRLSVEDRHRVRIDAKRLRYVVEGLAPVFHSRKAKRYARHLEDLQDALGRANDAATGDRLLTELDPPDTFAAFAHGWFAARMQGDPALLASLARRLAASRRFWHRSGTKHPPQI